MTGQIVLLIAVAVALLALASLFDAARRAVAQLSVPRVEKLVDDDVRGATTLLRLVSMAPSTTAALALLSTTVRSAYVVILAVLGAELTGMAVGLAAGTVVSVLTLFIVADLVPARVVDARPERVGARLARLAHAPVVALMPLVRLAGRVRTGGATGNGEEPSSQTVEERMRDLIEVAAADAAMAASKEAMLTAALDLDDTVVREIMVPRPDMVSVASRASLEEVVDTVLEAGHSRIPVYGEDRDEIEGVIYAKDLLHLLRHGDRRPWVELLRPPLVVPELKSVEELLRELQTQRVHLAVVVDEYGATVGLVTIEDILEELVGEIVDEYDHELPLVEHLGEARWRVDARLPVDQLADLVDTRLPDEEWDTVGGLLFGMLGHIAKPGEQVAVDGIELTAEQVLGRRISKVLVERRHTEEAS